MFDASVRFAVGDGRMTLFWEDAWLRGMALKHTAPNLLAAVASQARAVRTIEEALLDRRGIRDITGPLTVPVLVELVDALRDVVLTAGTPDAIEWKWTVSKQYSASSAYRAFHIGLELFPCGKMIWKTWAPGKCKPRERHPPPPSALARTAPFVGGRWSSWRIRDIALGGTKHEVATALLAGKAQDIEACSTCGNGAKSIEDYHTCGFLASCAVAASSLLPPFARAISKTKGFVSFIELQILYHKLKSTNEAKIRS